VLFSRKSRIQKFFFIFLITFTKNAPLIVSKKYFMDDYKIIKFKENKFEMDVNVSPEEDTVWLAQEQIARLFERDKTVITRHINSIYREKELDKESTSAKNASMPLTRKRMHTLLHSLQKKRP
jgi:hypothetical protein